MRRDRILPGSAIWRPPRLVENGLYFLIRTAALKRIISTGLPHTQKRGLEIVGGPVLLLAGASPLEATFQSLLGHPLLTGESSARYESRGTLRRCDDAQLILCNLAVRRDLFLKF